MRYLLGTLLLASLAANGCPWGSADPQTPTPSPSPSPNQPTSCQQIANPFHQNQCPQVYQVNGNAPLHKALNIVVLPDGFTESELDDFRCAAGLIVEKLISEPPFNEFSDSINVYRIDLAASSSGIEYNDPCGSHNCSSTPPVWPSKQTSCEKYQQRHNLGDSWGDPVPPVVSRPNQPARCLSADLRVKGCPSQVPACEVMWPVGGQQMINQIASCAPAQHIVVVLANSGYWAGGGIDGEHPLSVSTLEGIDTWHQRARLLLHELGHSNGLLDEYADETAFGSELELPGFHSNRNVVKGPLPSNPPYDAPWQTFCDPAPCKISCGSGSGCCSQATNANPSVGLREGAYYHPCGFFRASSNCCMKKPLQPFCQACRHYLRDLFQSPFLKMQPNVGGPHSTNNPET